MPCSIPMCIYIKTNLTGYMQEDKPEMEALNSIYTNRSAPVKVGSVKANVGHMEGNSGLVQLVKGCLMLENREFYPQANYTKLHPELQSADQAFQVQTEYEKYNGDKKLVFGMNVASFTGQVTQ